MAAAQRARYLGPGLSAAVAVHAEPPAVPAPAPGPPDPAPHRTPPQATRHPVPQDPAPRGSRCDELDDQTLVVRAQEGDVRAFEVLARRHQTALYRLAVRVLGNRADAQDALQDALLDGWRRIHRFRGESTFSTWMYRIVTNRCLGMLRRNASPVPMAELAEGSAVLTGSGDCSPERAAEVDAGMVALGAALAALPHDQRVCFVLRELEGLRYGEISEITGVTETAVRGRIHRARRTLAEVMRPWR